jgi:phosphate transport system protein
MTTSVRTRFERGLTELNESVLGLGSLARQAVARAVSALVHGDAELAREVIAGDPGINQIRFDVEKRCYALLATEQPVAGDLRAIVAALIVTTDLERIGDHGKKIARICLRMLETPRPIPLGDIPRMAEMALAMLDRALRALASRDVVEARAVCLADDQVDALYKQTFNVILSYMLENPRLIGPGTHLLQVAHELERVADRATNIGERVIYAVTGELADLNV